MSHYSVLISTPMPESTLGSTVYSSEELAEISILKAKLRVKPDALGIKLKLKKLLEKSSPFEQQIENEVAAILAPYDENSEDRDNLEFVDEQEELEVEYESGTTTCVRLLDGTIRPTYDKEFYENYKVQDGKVYRRPPAKTTAQLFQRDGRIGEPAPEFEVIAEYPLKSLYPSFVDCLEKHFEVDYDEEQHAYGYWHNPNAKWDWYQIGGRWPFAFLVREDCALVALGERGTTDNGPDADAPKGYRWVAGARKSDIQWEMMKNLKVQALTEEFQKLERWFCCDEIPEEKPFFAVKNEEGIQGWDVMLYKKGETLEDYLCRNGVSSNDRYPFIPYAFIDSDGWHGSGDMGWFGISRNSLDKSTWCGIVEDFIASVPNNHFLVLVDCHI